MANKNVILLIEDEKNISDFIEAILLSNDYKVLQATSGKEGLSFITSYNPDLVLLDLGLPDMDGIDVLKEIRSWSNIPVMVVSARGYDREKVEALDLGADDYVTKPFSASELLARVRTALRHSHKNTEQSVEIMTRSFEVGELKVDYEKRKVTMLQEEVHLTPIEYKIVVLLSKYAGRVLTHDFIIRNVWGPYANETKTLRVNMANIRRKIEKNSAQPVYILTELGVGYRMIEELLR